MNVRSMPSFYDLLQITMWEFCMCGEHKFETPLNEEPECPLCDAPRRDENNQRTTCTFTKYDLKNKLRSLFFPAELCGLVRMARNPQ
mmetsp:Transcript_28513/g.47894  ORF Transcript_28513/g.47894 Transcript_28513/m.47894 type:complete len:87 (+) Transcript_28513:1212-1472(+)